MWKFILLTLLFSAQVFSQDNFIGQKEIIVNDNGLIKKKIVLNPLPYKGIPQTNTNQDNNQPVNPLNNTDIKWSYTDPAAIGDFCLVSGNGNYNVTAWDLNKKRVSLYGNANSTPFWEYNTDPNGFLNFISISDTGGIIATGSYQNVYLFRNNSGSPFFNFDLTHLADTGIATNVAVTKDGGFFVCSASRNDSSTLFGFNTSSSISAWSKRIVPLQINNGSIYGIRLSGNDSLIIVNTYGEFFIFKTYTGEMIFRGLINPGAPNNGTQAIQGINGDGSVIAIVNYSGLVTCYQWNGTTYNVLWANQEPPGLYYNWYTSVDITYDGNYVAAGTLNFLSSSTFDGKVKVFKRTGNGTPIWTFAGCGDEVTALAFSKSGNILSASSWGEFNNTAEDLYIFKTFLGNVPIYKLNTPGSFFYCNTSSDGKTVVASGKAVHARQFGNGGLLYNIAVDTTDIPSSIRQLNSNLASDYNLYQNYPNPFNPATKIKFDITRDARSETKDVKLIIYSAVGREVETLVNENLSPGSYEVEFNGANLSSGIYFYSLKAGNFTDTKKLILLK